MRLTEATEETLEKLARAWQRAAKRMADEDRPLGVLAHVINQSDSTWYQLAGYDAWMYIRDIKQGHMASLHALNLDGQRALDRDLIRREMLQMMRDFDLRRLNVLVPAPVVDVKAILYWLGFEAEGRIRDACIFDREFADSEIFGILRRELEHDLIQEVAPPPRKEKKRRRRSRRNRKKKWANSKTHSEPQQQTLGKASPKPVRCLVPLPGERIQKSQPSPETLPTSPGS